MAIKAELMNNQLIISKVALAIIVLVSCNDMKNPDRTDAAIANKKLKSFCENKSNTGYGSKDLGVAIYEKCKKDCIRYVFSSLDIAHCTNGNEFGCSLKQAEYHPFNYLNGPVKLIENIEQSIYRGEVINLLEIQNNDHWPWSRISVQTQIANEESCCQSRNDNSKCKKESLLRCFNGSKQFTEIDNYNGKVIKGTFNSLSYCLRQSMALFV